MRLDKILLAAIIFFAGVCLLFDGYTRLKGEPEIVVYLNKDSKEPAKLPIEESMPESLTITGDRAVLWWTVFCKACEGQFPSDAATTANRAVENVYGKIK